MNDGFLSAVEDKDNPDMLWVRARRREHLVDMMKKTGCKFYNIQYTKNRDYQFRIHVPKVVFASEIVPALVMSIDYTNFKNSVKDQDLKMFYSNVWGDGVNHLDHRNNDEFWADQMGFDYSRYENGK